MKIKAVIFGSTGMIGQGVLLECLKSYEVESVLVINRHRCGIFHLKLKEIILPDLFDLSSLTHELAAYNTCFFCLGVSSAGMSEKDYHKITFTLTTTVAETLLKINNEFRFCYISGAGTDSSEKGKIMWARVKGKTENALLAMPFRKAYMFRPGFIQPKKGIRSRTRLYNILYAIFSPLYFILKHFKNFVTDTETLGKAMILAVITDRESGVLESTDINNLVKNKQ
jgi:hypothetical protein